MGLATMTIEPESESQAGHSWRWRQKKTIPGGAAVVLTTAAPSECLMIQR